ncbi:hypothetical protein R1flu_018119 [Riccia fluitans]|uniref:F-box domain-containing protein n=1 Tax=Riccia fluitans TaxID=41844 RepID=A0ABD1ZGB1_9MARC
MARVVTRAMTRALEMQKVENYEDADPPSVAPSLLGNVTMDPTLWSNVPEHLMERILAHLSIPSLFRLRSVCKSWYSLVYSPTFLDLYSRGPPQGPWFWMFRNQDYREASTFNPIVNRWVSVSPPPFPINQMFFPIASAGGLLCFSSCANGRTTLVVTNPITRRWRELPPMLRIQTYHMAGMVFNRQSKVYKIVVVGIYGINDVYYPTTEEFNSDTNAWSITGDIPRGPLFPSRRTLLCNEILYSWCCDPPDGLVAYDMKQGTWSQIHAPMRHTLDSHMLIESQGEIYTVGGLRENSVTKSICIWELQKSELEWKEVDRMPEILCDEFLCGGKRFICIGMDGLVLLLVRGSDRLVLSYDLSKRVWRRLPGCPLADHRLRYGLIDGIAFEPRLDASV